ncbi:MAG: hypothetical protein AAGF12_18760, partial [Myxococcota bacterium]
AGTPFCATCPDRVLGSRVGPGVASGTTVGQSDDTRPSCRGGTASDLAFGWTAPATGRFTFDTIGSSFDTVLYLLSSCGGAELPGACDDDSGGGTTSSITLPLNAGQSIVIVVDGFGTAEGSYILNIAQI